MCIFFLLWAASGPRVIVVSGVRIEDGKGQGNRGLARLTKALVLIVRRPCPRGETEGRMIDVHARKDRAATSHDGDALRACRHPRCRDRQRGRGEDGYLGMFAEDRIHCLGSFEEDRAKLEAVDCLGNYGVCMSDQSGDVLDRNPRV